MQNDEAKRPRLPTKSARTSTTPLRQCGPRRVVAIPGSQFQKAGLGEVAGEVRPQLQPPRHLEFETHSLPALARRCPRGFAFCLALPTARLEIWSLGFSPQARPASGGRKDTKRKRERNIPSCIAR